MSKIIDGKLIAQKLKYNLKTEILNLKNKYSEVPGLAVIQVGNVAASSVYVKAKTQAAKEVGINVIDHHLEESTNQNDLINLINQLYAHIYVHVLLFKLCQLPIPMHNFFDFALPDA